MLKKLFVSLCIAFVLSMGAASVSAQKWVDLGTKEVKDRSEQDTWHVGKGKGEFSMEFSHYSPAPPQLQKELMAKYDKERKDKD